MKIYEYIREENERTVKILGLTFMKQTSDYMTSERYQSFLGGIVSTVKLTNPYTDKAKKEVKLFGKSIIRRIEEGDFRTYYFLGKAVKKVSLTDEFKKKYFKFFDKKHDDIYIIKANSGEVYLLLTYIMDEFLKRNNSKNPLLVATQRYHVDLIKMLCPNLPYVFIEDPRFKIVDDVFTIDKFRFFLLFSSVHFKQVEMDLKEDKTGQQHYFKSILKRLNMTEADLGMKKAILNPDDETSMLKKIKNTGLNLDNFVFISPGARSCKLYNENFWCEMINQFQDKGYDVFVNLVGDDIQLENAKNYKTTFLTYSEAFALVKRAKKVISLRSGFLEFLLQTGTPMDVLYTKFRNRHLFDDLAVEHVISGFSLLKIPNVDKTKITELFLSEETEQECIRNIVEFKKVDYV